MRKYGKHILEIIRVLFNIDDINAFYGKSHILHGVSMEVDERELVYLLGRNGVGKSTTLKSIVGLIHIKSGSISFKNREVLGLRPHKLARLGIGYVPEERRIFPKLTVRENLQIGIKPSSNTHTGSWDLEKIYQLFPALRARDSFKGGNISGGEQQMLSIGRTMMGNPEFVLMDEPTEGLAPLLIVRLLKIIRDIHEDGVAIMLVVPFQTMELGHRVYVMAKGQIVFSGSADELQANEELKKKYIAV